MNIEGIEKAEGKVCTKCGVWKPLEEYNKNKNTKDGRRLECRECQKEINKQWRENNKEHKKEYNKQWYETNKEHIKEYHQNNKEHIKEREKRYRENNKERRKEYAKQYRKDNEEYIKEREKQWRENNKEHIKEYIKEYGKQYHETVKQNNLQYISSLLEQINPMFKQLNLQVYGYVYKFENVKTCHVYIGQTINPLKERYRNSNIVQGWVEERLKYDTQKFKEELIKEDIVVTEVLDVAFCQYHLDKLEAYYIDKYNSFLNGYNNQEGNHITDDGIEEFNQILLEHNLEFVDGKLIENKNAYRSKH